MSYEERKAERARMNEKILAKNLAADRKLYRELINNLGVERALKGIRKTPEEWFDILGYDPYGGSPVKVVEYFSAKPGTIERVPGKLPKILAKPGKPGVTPKVENIPKPAGIKKPVIIPKPKITPNRPNRPPRPIKTLNRNPEYKGKEKDSTIAITREDRAKIYSVKERKAKESGINLSESPIFYDERGEIFPPSDKKALDKLTRLIHKYNVEVGKMLELDKIEFKGLDANEKEDRRLAKKYDYNRGVRVNYPSKGIIGIGDRIKLANAAGPFNTEKLFERAKLVGGDTGYKIALHGGKIGRVALKLIDKYVITTMEGVHLAENLLDASKRFVENYILEILPIIIIVDYAFMEHGFTRSVVDLISYYKHTEFSNKMSFRDITGRKIYPDYENLGPPVPPVKDVGFKTIPGHQRLIDFINLGPPVPPKEVLALPDELSVLPPLAITAHKPMEEPPKMFKAVDSESSSSLPSGPSTDPARERILINNVNLLDDPRLLKLYNKVMGEPYEDPESRLGRIEPLRQEIVQPRYKVINGELTKLEGRISLRKAPSHNSDAEFKQDTLFSIPTPAEGVIEPHKIIKKLSKSKRRYFGRERPTGSSTEIQAKRLERVH